jgi:hypothetical protein
VTDQKPSLTVKLEEYSVTSSQSLPNRNDYVIRSSRKAGQPI